MCYCRHLHHLCCEADEFRLLSLQMKHHLGLYDVHQNCHEKKKKKKKKQQEGWHVTLGRKEFRYCS